MLADRLHNIRRLVRASDGARGRLGVARTVLAGRLPGLRGDRPVTVPMRELDGRPLVVRPRTSDLYNATWYYLDDLYLPPPGIRDESLGRICELGTNIGAALTALALRYRAAELLGVEPDPGNAAIARRNLARFGSRAEIVQAGVWDQDAELVVERDSRHGEHGFTVRPRAETDPASADPIEAFSIDTLFGRRWPNGDVDYVHMSIEGSEPRILAAGGEWATRTRSMTIELHPYLGFAAEQCLPALRALGFDAWVHPELPEKWAYAVRR
jgi:FkbM family methyltransferase